MLAIIRVQNVLSSSFPYRNIKISKNRNIILPVVLYGCEAWSCILKEERRLRLLGGIFWPKSDEVTGEWRKPCNEELNYLYSSPTIVRVIKSRRMSWLGHVAPIGGEEVYVGVWWGNLRERDHFEDPGVDGDTIKMDLKVVGWVGWGMGWIDLAQDMDRCRALVNSVMNLRVS
jgi:hypothetical protein